VRRINRELSRRIKQERRQASAPELFKSSRFLERKYKSRTCICNQGHLHPSRLEAGYCNKLLILKKGGYILDFVWQKKWPIYVNDIWITNHFPDFTVETDHGTEIHETKGFEGEAWGIRKRLIQAVYPDIPYIVIK